MREVTEAESRRIPDDLREVTEAELFKMSPEELREYARQRTITRRIPMTMRNSTA